MSKVMKKIDPVGRKIGLYGGGGGSKDPASFTGGERHKFVEQAKQKFGLHAIPNLGGGGDWKSYVDKVQSGGFAKPPPKPPEPMAFEFPSFEMPDYSSMFQMPRAPQGSAAKTVAERINEEAGQFAGVKAGEKIFSAAQGVSTRLRAAVRQEEDKPGGLALGESAGTILGRRGTGGATSRRRTRLSNY